VALDSAISMACAAGAKITNKEGDHYGDHPHWRWLQASTARAEPLWCGGWLCLRALLFVQLPLEVSTSARKRSPTQFFLRNICFPSGLIRSLGQLQQVHGGLLLLVLYLLSMDRLAAWFGASCTRWER